MNIRGAFVSSFRSFPCVLLALLATCLSSPVAATEASDSENEGTRFVVIGHLYPIANHTTRIDRLIDAINAEKPDLVFFLGDCLAWNHEFQKKLKAINGKLLFVPGNHDFEDRDRLYLQEVGYLESIHQTLDANFILMNTSEGLEHQTTFLEDSLKKINPDHPVILLGHHHIWDDTKISKAPYSHEKSFLFSDLYPIFRGRVDYIFSGDDNNRYFGSEAGHTNKVYFCAMFGDLVCYACGMGRGTPKTTYVVVDVIGGQLQISPRSLQLDDGEEIVESIQPFITTPPATEILIQLWRNSRFWAGVLFSLMLVSGLYLACRIFRR